MARWSPVTIAGGAYSDDARPWACQDTVNYIPVPAEREGTRSAAMLRGLPGFTTFCATMQEAPVRCLHNVEGLLLAVAGNKLYSIGTDGAASEIGTVPGVRRATMAHNQIEGGHEVMVANGQSGYVYKTTDGSFAQVTDEGFPGLKTTDFVDGYIAGIEPAGRYWFHSQLLAATDYNTIDRYDAESAPDKMVALIVSHREVLVLNERSGAFFRNSGSATGTFQNSNGMEMEVGCAATHAVARLDNSVFWLGSDGIVYRLAGHQPQRVSTGPVEQAISRCDMANAFAFTFEDRGHKVFYLTFPDGHTWGYDVWTGEWHRRQSKGFDRWRLSSLVKWNGAWIGGDFSNGRLYQLDWAVQHEAGEELIRRRVLPVLHDNANDVIVNALRLIVDTGLGSDSDPRPAPLLPPLTITGDLPDGIVSDSGTYQYTIAGGSIPVQDVTISAGALPSGATIDAAGLVTYEYVVSGSYAWTVSVTDAADNVATVNDTAEVVAAATFVTDTHHYTGPATSLTKAADPIPWASGVVIDVVSLSPNGQYLAGGDANSLHANRFQLFKYVEATDAWVGLAAPASLPAAGPMSFAWSPDGAYLAVGVNSFADIALVYKRTGDTFTRLAAPSPIQSSQSTYVKWSPDGLMLACGSSSTGDNLWVYDFDPDTDTFSGGRGGITTTGDQTAAIAFVPGTDNRYIVRGNSKLNLIDTSGASLAIVSTPSMTDKPDATAGAFFLNDTDFATVGAIQGAATGPVAVWRVDPAVPSIAFVEQPAAQPTVGAARRASLSTGRTRLAIARDVAGNPDVYVYANDDGALTASGDFPAVSARAIAASWRDEP